MKIKIRVNGKVEELTANSFVVEDKDGQEFRIAQDKFNGIEVLLEHGGSLTIQSCVSNQIVLTGTDYQDRIVSQWRTRYHNTVEELNQERKNNEDLLDQINDLKDQINQFDDLKSRMEES